MCAAHREFYECNSGSVVWHWDFGDGDTSSLHSPNHTYENAGIYTVSLTTTDTLGIVQIYQMDSIVRVAGPRAGFIVSQSASCTSTQVSFIDTSQNATSWEWISRRKYIHFVKPITCVQQRNAELYHYPDCK